MGEFLDSFVKFLRKNISVKFWIETMKIFEDYWLKNCSPNEQ